MKKALALLLAASCTVGFSFNENWSRYPRPDEILLIFQDRFPLGFNPKSNQVCVHLLFNNRSFLGDNRATDGKPLVSQPNVHFVKWYVGCVASAAAAEVAILKKKQDSIQIPGSVVPEILDWIPAPADSNLKSEFLQSLSNTEPLSSGLKEHVVTSVVARLIGPDVVLNEKAPLFNASLVRARILANLERIEFTEAGFKTAGFDKTLQGQEKSIYGYLAAAMLVTALQTDEFLLQ